MAKTSKTPRPRQHTSTELRDDLLEFIKGKFYQEEGLAFIKDKPRLLPWVVLWPATWLNERGITLQSDRYRELLISVLKEAAMHGNTTKVAYRPAWLRAVVQRHFAIREDIIYAEGKSVRTSIDLALTTLGRVRDTARPPDPLTELAAAAKLLKAGKRAPKQEVKEQLTLL